MVKVKLHASWRDDKSLRELLSKQLPVKYKWGDLEFVSENDRNFDYLVIFNFPRTNFNFPSNKTIIFQGEPDFVRKQWGIFYKPDENVFLKVFETNKYFSFPRWSINKDYHWLLNNNLNKSKVLSAVVSNLTSTPKHKERLHFVQNYLSKIDGFDHYGKGFKFLENKEDGLFDYKYTFQSENYIEDGNFTEKLLDSILSECVCFYDGCPNIEKFIDSSCYIKIDVSKPKEAFDIIKKSIEDDEYSKRIDKIREEKKRIVKEFHVFPLIEDVIKKDLEKQKQWTKEH